MTADICEACAKSCDTCGAGVRQISHHEADEGLRRFLRDLRKSLPRPD